MFFFSFNYVNARFKDEIQQCLCALFNKIFVSNVSSNNFKDPTSSSSNWINIPKFMNFSSRLVSSIDNWFANCRTTKKIKFEQLTKLQQYIWCRAVSTVYHRYFKFFIKKMFSVGFILLYLTLKKCIYHWLDNWWCASPNKHFICSGSHF